MAQSELEILIKIKNEAERGIRQFQEQMQGVQREFLNTKSAIEMATGALATFAGTKMLGGFISATREANLQLAQAQFYANALGTATAKRLMPHIIEAGKEMQKLYGISDELASKAYAKMIAKFGEGGKTLTNLDTLIKLHKLRLWDLDSSTTMLMGSTDDMRRALLFLARALAVEVNPEMDDFQEILDRIRSRVEEIDMTPLGNQIDKFKEHIKDIAEKAGVPFMDTMNLILGYINFLIEKFPILGEIIAVVVGVIAAALAGLGIGLFFKTLLAGFGLTLAAAGPWGMAIGAVIGMVAFWIRWLNKNWEEHKETVLVVAAAIVAILTALGLFIASPIAVIVGLIGLIGLAAITVKENWVYIRGKLIEIWNSLQERAKEIWGGLKDWFQEHIIKWFEDKIKWIGAQVEKIKDWVGKVKETISGIPSKITGGVTSIVKGSKQMGGYIPETGLYLLHRGEYVVPARLVGAGAGIGGNVFNVYFTGNTFMSDEDTAVKIGDMIIKVLQRHIRI